ncbi:hypothetical protein PFICI_12402 [Pestalotiopsis fici W106-1]|uniref:Uncharacterized protein n=1 Tax=Pestalotiopsis fici (strain W106-1 / CGMCC3.15140) TaxID=1229662 RepID=W3WNM3_PESFW|nr:uncharacterized protein PFICI_12402 [Pestalotiopsis fici W106-1]ETS75458.1 hypothetical protein PFICI_12402 [Pestalotiopsis fici W106-1]
MASEIHRRRTGRGLKVTEEIVIKEEMYEEEEDDLPRQFRHLTRHLQTNSPTMNHRVSAYITTQAAMASMARYNEVNRLFSESFPSAAALQQQLNNSIYMAPLMTNNSHFSPTSPTMPSPSAQTDSSFPGMDRRISTATTATTSCSTPPALSPSPSSHTISTPDLRLTPRQSSAQMYPPLDVQPQQQQHTSAFTSELSNEAKMLGMVNIDVNDPMAQYFFGGDSSSFNFYDPQSNKSSQPALADNNESAFDSGDNVSPTDTTPTAADEILYSPMEGTFNSHFENYSQAGTPSAAGLMADPGWDNFIDFGSEQ